MWYRWLPWRWLIRRVARAQGFIDPFAVISKLQRFSQPSEVAVPVELLRLAAVLQARGLINAQTIQHNLDWVWPFWVEQQFNPRSPSFIPRAFSMTHINMTHRNWTAVGMPNFDEMPIVDPRGLVTPFYDSWSIDAWIVAQDRTHLIPSRLEHAEQSLLTEDRVSVRTKTQKQNLSLESEVAVAQESDEVRCRITFKGLSNRADWLALCVRPYNPEGISFIDKIVPNDAQKWTIGRKQSLFFDTVPDRQVFSTYREGDVYRKLFEESRLREVKCDAGMATAAALFQLEPSLERVVAVEVPLPQKIKKKKEHRDFVFNSCRSQCKLSVPDPKIEYLFQSSTASMLLHKQQKDIYPGPFTYKHFWFRDASLILNAMMSIGFLREAEEVLDSYPGRQTAGGYFRSQDGEWDSNGQAIWVLDRFCKLSNAIPKKDWQQAVEQGAFWMARKRQTASKGSAHDGLLPPGFSAEHLGPNDYYYWDDFWSVQGFRSAADMFKRVGLGRLTETFKKESDSLLSFTEQSLRCAEKRLGHAAMPASPYRRMDTGAIGSIVCGYPLNLFEPRDRRLLATIDYLMEHFMLNCGFFHDMSHSGINPYLTLHIAQVLLRARDPRFWAIMKRVAELASPTGQWPEAIHPQTQGGCMGDGQHVWASAEWVMMVRNCFVREEGDRLILFSGIPKEWYESDIPLQFGPTLTPFGPITVFAEAKNGRVTAHWEAEWHQGGQEPRVEVVAPEHTVMTHPKERQIQFPI